MNAIPWSWAWTPLLVIGIAAIANAVMLTTAHRVRPQAVEDHPWLRSAAVDADKAALARGARRALALVVETDADGGLHARLVGDTAGVAAGTLECWRPDDRAGDRLLNWPDPAQPLTLPLTGRGRWRLTFTAGSDGAAVACQGLAVRTETP